MRIDLIYQAVGLRIIQQFSQPPLEIRCPILQPQLNNFICRRADQTKQQVDEDQSNSYVKDLGIEHDILLTS